MKSLFGRKNITVLVLALLVVPMELRLSAQPDRVFGVDVSAVQQQGQINWTTVAQQSINDNGQNYPISFAYIRATKGRTNLETECDFTDADFISRAQAAMSAGILVGAYHVPLVTNETDGTYTSPAEEAEFFVSIAGPYITSGYLRPFLDMETNSCGHPQDIGWAALATWVENWMNEVHTLTGIWPLIYCSGDFRTQLGPYLSGQYDLFVADYFNPPNPDAAPAVSPWTSSYLYQYNEFGNVNGIGNVDLDVFQGSPQNFQSLIVIPNSQAIGVTVASAPSGLQVVADGSTPALTTPITLNWIPNSSHTLSAATPQYSSDSLTQYVFAAWSTGSISEITVEPATTTTITALFNLMYDLNLASTSGGSITPSGGFYAPGASVAISATPSPGYSFSGWTGLGSGSYSGSSASVNITVNGPISEMATFVPTPVYYTVTLSSSPVGDGVTIGGASYQSGSLITVSAAPNQGFAFVNWTANGVPVSANASFAFMVSANTNLVANFSGGRPQGILTLTTDVISPSSLAADGTNIYWTEYNGGGLVRQVSRSGGTITTLVGGLTITRSVMLSGTNVYFYAQSQSIPSFQVIPKGGGASQAIISGISQSVDYSATDGTNIYWTEYSGNVRSVPITGGSVTTLAMGVLYADGIAVDNSNVYWTTANAFGPIWKVSKVGGVPQQLNTSSGTPGVAADGISVFWTDPNYYAGGAVLKAQVTTGAVTALTAGSIDPWALAVDANYAYWTENNAMGTIKQVGKWGGMPVILASGLNNPTAIAVDQTTVYWSEANAIRAVSKSITGPLLSLSSQGQGTITFSVAGPTLNTVFIQSSSDLSHWTTISTSSIPSIGPLFVTNQIASSPNALFFRAVLP
jgi:GH25 family lysozyme M1 (1,4-beta-N-acetylmuramidase)